MKVSHNLDHITHAVIGGEEKIELEISSTAEFFHIISDSLYSNKILAVAREILCNAWDSHIESNLTDIPIDISITNDRLIIRDYGKGISHENMIPIYGTYGSSHKSLDGDVTGGFGLGSKAPWAYTDIFEVTSYNNGTKSVYSMSKSSAELNGKPSITRLVSVPTTESGLQVSLDIKSSTDSTTFMQYIKNIAKLGLISVKINGELMKGFPSDLYKNKIVIVKSDYNYNQQDDTRIFIKYGNVIYPLPAKPEYSVEYFKLIDLTNKANPYSHGSYVGINIIIEAEPNSLSITPSRESLSFSKKTLKEIEILLKNINKYIDNICTDNIVDIVKNIIDDNFINDYKYNLLYRFNFKINNIDDYFSKNNNYLNNPSTILGLFLDNYINRNNYIRDKIWNYTKDKLLNKPEINKNSILLKILSQYKYIDTYEFNRKYNKNDTAYKLIIRPLISKMYKNNINVNKLYINKLYINRHNLRYNDQIILLDKAINYSLFDFDNTLNLSKKVVILSRSMKAFAELFKDEVNYKNHKYQLKDTKEYININGAFVYVLPSKKIDEINKIKEFFTRQQYYIIDLLPEQDEKTKELREITDKNKTTVTNIIPTKQRTLTKCPDNKYYPRADQLVLTAEYGYKYLNYNELFNFSEIITDTQFNERQSNIKYLSNPEFYIPKKHHKGSFYIDTPIKHDILVELVEKLGHKGIIVPNSSVGKKLGIPFFTDWLHDKSLQLLDTRPEDVKSISLFLDGESSQYGVDFRKYIKLALVDDAIANYFDLDVSNINDPKFIAIYKYILYKTKRNHPTLYKKYFEITSNNITNAAMSKLYDIYRHNQYTQFININNMIESYEISNKCSKEIFDIIKLIFPPNLLNKPKNNKRKILI